MDYKSLANFAAARKVAKEAPNNYRPVEVAGELAPRTRFDHLWDAIGAAAKISDDAETGCIIQVIGTTESGVSIEVWLSRLNEQDKEDDSRYHRVVHAQCYDEDEVEIGTQERIVEADLTGKSGSVSQSVLGQLTSLEGSLTAVLTLQDSPGSKVMLDYAPKQ